MEMVLVSSEKDIDQEDVEETMCGQSWMLETFFMSGVEVELCWVRTTKSPLRRDHTCIR